MADSRKGTGMTVSQLAHALYQYPSNTPVGIALGAHSDLQILSIYPDRESKNKTTMVWIDVVERPK